MNVTIVGGGVMGMTCAWRLAQRGAEVTLLDQGTLGSGASMAALGALWPSSVPNPGPLQRLQRESLWQYPEFIRELSIAADRTVNYLRRGKLEPISSEKHLAQCRREVEFATHYWPPIPESEELQPAMQILSPDDALRLEPEAAVKEWGAVICHRSAQVDVSDLLAALRLACKRSGVHIRENAKAQDVAIDTGRPSVSLANGRVESDCLLICAGHGVPSISQAFPLITPVKGQALLMRSNRPVIGHIIKNGALFLVPWPDGRILVGSTTEPEAGFDVSNTAAGVAFLAHGAIETCPALAGARIESVWAGLRPTGPKRQPILGPLPNWPRVFICAGHFKVGIGMAPRSADIMTRWLLGGDITPDEHQFVPGSAGATATHRSKTK